MSFSVPGAPLHLVVRPLQFPLVFDCFLVLPCFYDLDCFEEYSGVVENVSQFWLVGCFSRGQTVVMGFAEGIPQR